MNTKRHSALSFPPSVFALLALFALNVCAPAQTNYGNALSFNGANNYVCTGIPAMASNYSFSAWVYLRTGGNWEFPAGVMSASNCNSSAEVQLGSLTLSYTDPQYLRLGRCGSFWATFSTTAVPMNRWVHIALTVSSTKQVNYYVNGSPAGSWNADGYNLTIGPNITLGDNTYRRFNGMLDEVQIWNKQCSASEIQAIFSSPIAATASNLVAYWKFNEADGIRVLDATTNHLNGTLVNRPLRLPSLWTPSVIVNGANPYTNECHTTFSDPGAIPNILPVAVAAGNHHSLALRADGTVCGWGNGGSGQTNGAAAGNGVAMIAGGAAHSLALKADGTVVAWGGNSNGQTNVPARATNVVAIAAGPYHNLALKADGTVVGWGQTSYGKTNAPPAATNAVAVAAGCDHSLVLKADGSVIAWGDSSWSQTSTPGVATNVVAIAAGYYHNLALKADGSVVAWGRNLEGQTSVPAGATTGVVAIAAGANHSLALRFDGTVVGWGNNNYGQRNTAGLGTNVVAIAGGYWHSLALNRDGTVIAWGDNSSGQITVPTGLALSDLPVTVSGIVNTNAPGTYPLTYTATNALGFVASAMRTVNVTDTLAPSLTLLGPDPLTNECHAAFVDPGATASDACAGSLAVTTNSTVNPDATGMYTIDYSATDPSGNCATNSRTVFILDTTPPMLTLLGDNPLVLTVGTLFVDPGASAADVCDAAPTVATNGTVNTSLPSSYTITYTTIDVSGNSAQTNRTVMVEGLAIAVTTLPPTQVNSEGTNASATLNGTVNPDGRETCAWFEWGPNGQFGNLTTVSNLGSGSAAASLSADLTNLIAGMTCQYRLVASNSLGLAVGSSQCLGSLQLLLQGTDPMFLLRSNSFTEPGFFILDPCQPFAGGSNVTGTVDANVDGTYSLTYSATNTLGWTATATRMVRVMPPLTTPVVRVNNNAPFTSQQNGSSWANAFRELRDALTVVNPTTNNPIEIWVATGTYKPTAGSDREAAFILKSGLTIRGGFAGNESVPEARLASGYWTVLSGDIAQPQTNSISHTADPQEAGLRSEFDREDPGVQDNSYNVIWGADITQVTLERLYVVDGNANYNGYTGRELESMTYARADTNGAPNLTGETVIPLDRRVMGGGIFLTNSWDSANIGSWNLALTNVILINNAARGYGGAVAIRGSRTCLAQCLFLKNACDYDGGALWGHNQAWFYHSDCRFWYNQAGGSGGAVHVKSLATIHDEFKDPTGRISQALPHEDSVRMINATVGTAQTAFGVYLVESIGEFVVDELTDGLSGINVRVATGSVRGFLSVAGKLAWSLYGFVTVGMDLVELGKYLAKENGVPMDTTAARNLDIVIENFNLYATPTGWLTLLGRAVGVDIVGWIGLYLTPWGWNALLAQIGHEAVEPNSLDKQRLGLKLAQECLYNARSNSVVVGSQFRGNSAGATGGAMSCIRDNVDWERCIFEENTAMGDGAALVSSVWNQPRLMNCVFYRNYSTNGHSGMLNTFNSRARIINCTCVENGSGTTNGFCLASEFGSEVRLGNSILWGNSNPANTNGGADVFTLTPEEILRGGTNLVAEYNKDPVAQINYWAQTDIIRSYVPSINNTMLGRFEHSASYCQPITRGLRNVIYMNDGKFLKIDPNGAFHTWWRKPVYDEAVTSLHRVAELQGIREDYGFYDIGWGNLIDLIYFQSDWWLGDLGNKSGYCSDPLLVDGYMPTPSSLAINGGARDLINPGTNVFSLFSQSDLRMNPRETGGNVDMGAIEGGYWPSGIVYVHAGALGDNSGRDWANAMVELTDALSMPGVRGRQIWVAAGTYFPASDGSQSASFSIPDQVKVYGGFNGTETSLDQRDWRANPTTLSGNIGAPDSDWDNSYHVVTFSNSCATLGGFTITGGRATGGSETNGGGIYISESCPLIIEDCALEDNVAAGCGGAIYSVGTLAQRSDANSAVVNCRFERNAASSGGAIGCADGRGSLMWDIYQGWVNRQIYIANCLFVSNSISGGGGCYGGALFATNSYLAVDFCTFYRNSVVVIDGSNGGGGALDFQGCENVSYSVRNSLFWANTATNLGGVPIRPDRQQVTWDSEAVGPSGFQNNLVQGLLGVPGVDAWWYSDYNSDSNPSFVDAPNGDFHLNPTSAAVDAVGDASGWLPNVDLDCNPRLVNGRWDLGAFEYQGAPIAGRYRVSLTRLVDGRDVIYQLDLLPGTNALPAAYHWEVNAGGNFDAVPDMPPFQGITNLTLFITNPPYTMNGWLFRACDDDPAGFISDEVQLHIPAPVYVKADATGLQDGSSWFNAFTRLQDAVLAVAPAGQVWVAAGTYYPPSARLPSQATVYGGFNGTETNLNQRDWLAHPTILSGEAGVPGDLSDNTDCLVASGPNDPCQDAVLDGFTLSGASGAAVRLYGGSMAVRNCTIENSRHAAQVGGGGTLELTACIVRHNTVPDAQSGADGAVYISGAALNATNCLFHNNTVLGAGGALACRSSNVRLVNCTVAANSASQNGAGVNQTQGTVSICNSIIWGNRGAWGSSATKDDQVALTSATLSHSCIQGAANLSPGDLNFDPGFVDPTAEDFRLSASSPMMDGGDNTCVASLTRDLAGAPRVFGPAVDLGAFEAQTAGERYLFTRVPGPAPVESCPGIPATFTVVGAANYAFYWQLDSGTGFVNVTNGGWFTITDTTNASTLTVSPALPEVTNWKFRFGVVGSSVLSVPVQFHVHPQQALYVNAAAQGANNGLDWANAFTNLQAALEASPECAELWVAQGVYDSGRFTRRSATALYGGFSGGETNREQRDWTNHPTVLLGFMFEHDTRLDGILDGFTIAGDTSGLEHIYIRGCSPVIRNCVLANNDAVGIRVLDSSPTIENCVFSNNKQYSFIIESGSPTITNCSFAGNAVFSIYNCGSPAVVNCLFTNNTDSAIYNRWSTPTISNCVFVANQGRWGGGAILNYGFPQIARCVFRGNSAIWGGAIANWAASYTPGAADAAISGCEFTGNNAVNGGAICTSFSSSGATITNCLFVANTSKTIHHWGVRLAMVNCTLIQGGISSIWAVGVQVRNSILWGNGATIVSDYGTAQVAYSIVQGVPFTGGSNVLACNPLFRNPEAGDYRLDAISPAIDAGDSLAAAGAATDLDGLPRLQSSGVDLGAYEFQDTATGSLSMDSLPVSASVCVNRAAQFTATGQLNPSYTVAWQRQVGSEFVILTNDATYTIGTLTNGSTLTITNAPAAMNGDTFRLQVLDAATNTLYSSPSFSLTVFLTILHVDGRVTTPGNGLSWSNAFASLDQALAAAGDCCEIWVAAGTYVVNRDLVLKDGVPLFGGFAGTETAREQRDWAAHPTILQATPGHAIFYAGSAGRSVGSTAVVDGFTLTGANGYAALFNQNSSPTIANCTFDGNAHYAVYNNQYSSPAFTNCVFQNNAGQVAMCSMRSSPTLRHCLFLNNRNGALEEYEGSSALFEDCDFIGNSAGFGGVFRAYNSSVSAVRCRFLANTATTDGGVVWLTGASARLTGCLLANNAADYGGALAGRSSGFALYNCTLSRNRANSQGGGLYLYGGAASVYNSILWNNSNGNDPQGRTESAQLAKAPSAYGVPTIQVTNSCIQGLNVYAGNNNLPYDPLFLAPEGTNFTLSASSPALDAGNDTLVNEQTVDLAGAPRIAAAAVDLGAYELPSGPSGNPVQVYQVPASQAGCGSTTFTAKGLPGSATNFHWWYLADGTNPVAIPADGYHSVQAANDTSSLLISDAPAEFNGRRYQLQFSDGTVDYWAPAVTFINTLGRIIYVRAEATGANTGADWANAFTNLPDALAIGGPCSEIWVAAGTYSQSLPWSLKNGLPVYGGFSGTETNRTARDWVAHPTILHGPGNGQIFIHSGIVLDRSARLDGFVLENASDAVYNNGASPTIANCLFRSCSRSAIYNLNASPLIRGCAFASINNQAVANTGGAPQIEECQFTQNGAGVASLQGSSVTIAHCQFTNNNQRAVSQSTGSLAVSNCVFVANPGAVYCENSAVLVTHCAFLGNSAYDGAGLDLHQCGSASVVNCLFSGNFVGHAGAALFANASTLTVRNCTVSGNRAGAAAAGIYSQNGACSIYNSILWNNWSDPFGASVQAQFYGTMTDAQNNCVQGGAWGTWNTDPLFVAGVNPASAPIAAGDYRLSEASPLIDLGLDAQAAAIDVDLDGAARHVEGVDLGAYELQVGPATVLAFVTPPQVLIPGQLSGAITLQRRGRHNHAAAAEPDLVLTLATSSGAGVFRDWADTTNLSSIVITQGCSSVSLRYRDTTEGAPVLTVLASGLSSVTQTQIVTHSTRLAFATPPRTVELGALSDVITVQRQDDNGWLVAGESNLVVSLSSSSGAGVFRDLADTTNLTSLTITQESNSVSFRYRDSLLGEPVLTAAATGLGSGSQTQAVIRLSQNITFEPLPARVYGDAPCALNATASSGLPVSFSIASGPATVSSNLLTITGTGLVSVRASQSGDPTNQPAPDVDQSFTVAPATLTLAAHDASRRYGQPDPVFTGMIAGLQYGDVVTATYAAAVTPTTPPGAYPIVPAPVDVEGKLTNYLVFLTNGMLTISPGPASTLVFATPPRTNALGALSDVITVQRQDDDGWLVAGESDLLVSLSTTSSGGVFRDLVDTTNFTSLILTQGASSVSFRYRDELVGEPVLTAGATGLASATQTQTVTRLSQTITFAALPARTYGAPPFELNATASSGLAVSFSRLSGPAIVTSNLLTITGTGLVTVRASQPGDAGRQPAPDVDRSFAVAPAVLTIVANDAQRVYAEPDPVFAGTITGCQHNDDISATYAALGQPPLTEPPVYEFTLGGIYYPYHVAVSTEGRIYVSSSDFIYMFNSNGAYLGRWGGYGSAPGKLSSAHGVAVDSSNFVYVADYSNHRVQKFTQDGVYLFQWGGYGSGNSQFKYPAAVVVDQNGNVYVGDAKNYRIQKFSSNGTYLTQWGSYGRGNGQFDILYGGIAIDNSGNVYVADTFNYRIQKFTSNGAYLGQWGGTYGSGPGQFSRPFGLALDSRGCVYVCEDVNARVQKFTSDGTYLTQWGSEGPGNDQLHLPYGLTVDNRDRVFVADRSNLRIQVFRPTYGPPVTATTPPGTYPIVPTLLDPAGRLTNYLVSLTNGTLTIWPGAATNLVFTTPPCLLETGDLSDVMTIRRQDVWAHPISAEPDLLLGLNTTSGGGVFRDLADTTNLSSLTIPQGASSVSFRYRDTTMGTPILTVSAPGLSSATQTQIVIAATRLAFTTSAQNLQANQLSGVMTVQRQDDAARPILLQPDLFVTLSTTSGGGVFRDLADTTTLTSLIITQGGSSVSFRYRDNFGGTPVLMAEAPGLTSATQTQNVSRLSQTITFGALPGRTYGAPPFLLSATASSVLPVSFSLVSGPATLDSNLLVTTGIDLVTVRASQPGNLTYQPAPDVDRSFTITQAVLTVVADNAQRRYGETNPLFTGTLTGIQYGDNITATYAALEPPSPTNLPVFDSAFGSDRSSYAVAAAVGTNGDLYVADSGGGSILTFHSSGAFLQQWSTPTPRGLAVDRGNCVFVTEEYGHHVRKYSTEGVFLLQWGTYGSGNGQLNRPYHIAVDGNGDVYVGDGWNARIEKFNSSGTYLTNWGGSGAGDGQFGHPLRGGIAVDTDGNVYVADEGNCRIQKFTSNGGFLAKWGAYGSGPGQFIYPEGIALDSSGYVYVADSGNDRIQKFTSGGAYLAQWGSSGTNYGQFDYPRGLAINGRDELYVVDQPYLSRQRIQKFRPCYGPPVTPAAPAGAYTILPTLADPQNRLTNYLLTVVNGTLTVNPGPATNLVFTTPAYALETGGLSGAITVQRQGAWDYPVSNEPDLLVTLSTTSAGGVFRDLADTTNLSSVTITQGTSSISFRYRDSSVGAPVLTAAAPGLPSATQTQTVTKLNQTITFAALPGRIYGDPPSVLSATALSGLPVSFSIVSGPASLSTHVLTITGAGQVTVRASQAGDATYQPAPDVDRSFTVSKAVLTVVADDAQRAFGAPDPLFTGTISGIQYADTITALYTALGPPLPTNAPVFATAFGSDRLWYPDDVAVDSGGNVYVACSSPHRVYKYSGNGLYLTNWGSYGSGNGQFRNPMGVAVDRSNHVYVTDYSNRRVQRFTPEGVYELQWGTQGSGDGQFTYPCKVAVDSNGDVYVADADNYRVQKFTGSGVFLTKWGTQGSGNGELGRVYGGIAASENGHVFVADYFSHRVQKFTSSGAYLAKWGAYGNDIGQFYRPQGLALDSSGHLHVTDQLNHRIQKFTSAGEYLTQWGSFGSGNGQFNEPSGVAINSSNQVFVADRSNHRIQKFRPGNGPPVTATTPPGTYPIVPILLDPDGRLANYTVTSNSATLTILGPPGVFLGITPQPGPAFLLHCSGGASLGYTLQTSSNLVDWVTHTNVIAGTNGLFDCLEAVEAGVSPRFYRLRWP